MVQVHLAWVPRNQRTVSLAVSKRVSGFKNRRFQKDMVEEELKNDGASAFGLGTKEPAYSITTGNRYVRT